MQPADIGAVVAAGTPRLSPDGSLVAFVVSRVDLAENRYRSQIWLVPAGGSRPAEPFSAGEHGDASPAWSPDGRRLAFTSQRAKSPGGVTRTTVHSAPVAGGGETTTVATSDEPVRGLTWSPDGRQLAYVTRVRGSRYEIDDPQRQPPRHITRFGSRLDDVGWTDDRPAHVHVVAADGSTDPIDATPGQFQFADPAWAPDGQALVFSGATHDTWDLDGARDLFVWRFGAEGPVAVTKQTGVYGFPVWSPDGGTVVFLGVDESRKYPQNSRVGAFDLARGTHRWLGTSLDRTFAPFGEARAPLWDGLALVVGVEDRGRTHVYRVAVDSDEPPALVVGGERCVTGFDVAGGALAFAATTTARPAEIFLARDGSEVQLSHVTDSFVRRAAPRPAERFTAPSTGGADVDVWVYLPEGDGAGAARRHPALVNIHGGPFTQYGERFFDEAQLQAAAGFAVIMCNPRGSSGREEGWARAINGPGDPFGPGGGWGSVDYEDVLAATEAALARYPSIDPNRVGVIGGSYGGYLTTWIVGHTDRFAAACSERAVNNMSSEDYTSDISLFLARQIGATWFEDPEEYRRQSPITYVRDITTPLLILHSEDDLRCPIEQAEQLFAALRLLGREVDFYRFPAEGHELSRSGSPVHRVQRAELILEFFARHLQRS